MIVMQLFKFSIDIKKGGIMPRKKQLNVSGSKIVCHSLNTISNGGILSITLDIDVLNDDQTTTRYSYDIRGDERFSIDLLRTKIPNDLDLAQKNFFKVNISEWADRNYLHIDVRYPGNKVMQVTGIRL